MNDKITKLFATMLVTAMVLSVIPILNAAPPPAPAFYIEPESQSFNTGTTSPGATFNVTLFVSTTGDTFTYQYEVDFNPSQLQLVSLVYSAVATSQFFAGHAIIPVATIIDNTTGKILGGESLQGADIVHATAAAMIINMTFQIAASPPINGNLTSLISLNLENTYLLDSELNTVPNVALGSVSFLYIWSQPPKPHLDVEPASRTYDQFTNWNGTPFTEDVVIKGLSGGWFLGNATTELTYNNVLTSVVSVAFDPIWGTTAWANVNPTTLQFNVSNPSSVPFGDVKIATVTFNITGQGSAPPRAIGDSDVSTLRLLNFALGSTAGFFIATDPAVDGLIKVFAFSPSKPPHFEVSSETIDRSVGSFNITVSLVGVRDFMNIIGIQFRLGYDSAVLTPIAVYEGPFLPSFAALQPGPKLNGNTFFQSFIEDPDGAFGPHVIVGDLIFPNSTGQWNPPMPNGTGVVATITFQVPTVAPLGSVNTTLNIVDQLAVALDNLVSQNIVNALLDSPVNGTVTITNNFPGRMIDLYGGAVNSGMIKLDNSSIPQFTPPYGGQGTMKPMDMVEPQSLVYLNANVTYNFYPVAHKNVAFEVQEPDGTVYTKLSGFTDGNGVASVSFRMPWPDVNPESLFGVWNVTATVQLADITLNDTMSFHYDYLVHIWKVTTDKPAYNHLEPVQVHIEYGSHAQQTYPVFFVASIVDNLGVTVGIQTANTTVGGTVFSVYKNNTMDFTITLPKWAYAGIATVRVDGFNFEPTEGGVAITPEEVASIVINPH